MRNLLQRMSGSHRLGRILGIEVRVLYLLYGVILLLVLTQAGGRTGPQVAIFLLVIALYFGCVLLHELGHALAALKEGVGVRAIFLHPLGGMAQLQGQIPGPTAEIFIAVAGPFVSMLLATLAFLPFLLLGQNPLAVYAQGGGLLAALAGAFLINISLALFNLLPVFPMDGGRVATALAVLVLGPERGIRAMRRVALAGVALMVGIGLLLWLSGGNPSLGGSLILIGIFLYFVGQQELQARMYAQRYVSGASHDTAPFAREPWAQPAWDPQRGFVDDSDDEQTGWLARWKADRRQKEEEQQRLASVEERQRIDAILAKIKTEGIQSLTPEERDALHRASRSHQQQSGED